MNIIGATTTWNSIEIIEKFLKHYKKLGLKQLLVMDFHSVDGTLDILTSDAWSDFVRLVPFPGIAHLDSSNIFLSLAKELYPAGTMCLFCDPDEFLITPSMQIREAVWTSSANRMGTCIIPRFNMTASLEAAESHQDELTPFGALELRIDNRAKRSFSTDMNKEVLDPPWIFTAIPGKVLVRLEETTFIGDGDHQADCNQGESGPAHEGVYLLHYPFRTWEEFRNKIEMAKIDMGTNTYLPDSYGWQIRRWIRLSHESRLYNEYLKQFIEQPKLAKYLADGTLCVDKNVQIFNDSDS